MQGSASRPIHPALREGLVFGLILGFITITINMLQNFVVSDIVGSILGVIALIVTIALNLLAGVRASQRTGRIGTVALTGLIVELISYLFGAINILIAIFVFDTPLHHLRFLQATPGLAQQFITALIISFAVFLLLGTVIGAIGGLIGSRHAQLPMQI
jgi:hypothetical protein